MGRRGNGRQDFVGLLIENKDDAELEWLRSLKLADTTIEVVEAPPAGTTAS